MERRGIRIKFKVEREHVNLGHERMLCKGPSCLTICHQVHDYETENPPVHINTKLSSDLQSRLAGV